IAAGVADAGDGVTTLGSTLVVKVLSERPVFAPAHGAYSHRLGDRWLVGGASNSGGAVLRRFFDDAELVALSARIDPAAASGLDYYPLLRPGERFPVADPALHPRLEPVPADRAAFLHGLLEGIARIEALGYRRLAELGAPYPARVLTTGGGAGNPAWTAIRARLLGVPVMPAADRDAARGAAVLARGGYRAAVGR
ncbi:MAG: FGGY-family carbohydrate kinase, partial [Chromatiaceae bacterium]|nr:FGGY-family carbohydrate kinase [Chromatiaceae bacterium]